MNDLEQFNALVQLQMEFESLSERAGSIRNRALQYIQSKIKSLCQSDEMMERMCGDVKYAELQLSSDNSNFRLAGLMSLAFLWRSEVERVRRAVVDRLKNDSDRETIRLAVSLAESLFATTQNAELIAVLRKVMNDWRADLLLVDMIRRAIGAIEQK